MTARGRLWGLIRRRALSVRIAELLLVTVLAGVIEHVAWPIMVHGANNVAVAMGIESPARPAASGGGQATGDTITGPGGQCLDVLGNDTGGDGAFVDLWNCQSSAVDQRWTPAPDGSLGTLGRCLDIDGDGTAPGTKVELFDCNGAGGQVWERQSNGSVLNPQSGLSSMIRAMPPRTAPGWNLGPATAPRPSGSR